MLFRSHSGDVGRRLRTSFTIIPQRRFRYRFRSEGVAPVMFSRVLALLNSDAAIPGTVTLAILAVRYGCLLHVTS